MPPIGDQLNTVYPLRHLVTELMLDPQPQRCTVLDWKRRAVHLVSEDDGLRAVFRSMASK
jgi:hypothetical protein